MCFGSALLRGLMRVFTVPTVPVFSRDAAAAARALLGRLVILLAYNVLAD